MKFCKKCQIETERYKRGDCKQCMAVYGTTYNSINNAQRVATSAAYRAINKDKAAAYRAANKDKRDAYYSANKLKLAAYRAKNPDSGRRARHNYRANKLGNGGTLSKGLFDRLYKLQRGMCPVCKKELSNTKPRSHMDHIMPLARGGANTDDNIQILCQSCNNQKHAKHPIDFMQSKGFLI